MVRLGERSALPRSPEWKGVVIDLLKLLTESTQKVFLHKYMLKLFLRSVDQFMLNPLSAPLCSPGRPGAGGAHQSSQFGELPVEVRGGGPVQRPQASAGIGDPRA
jgi:hypothetical protein